jgi:hypothetical protein
MTKTEKRRRARLVRARLARFNDLQNKDVRAYVRKPGTSKVGNDLDYVAFNHLLFAQKELNSLVSDLRAEGYGQ